MLALVMQKELAHMSEAQRAQALAEEKRNRKLAKQLLLTGKARRRQELENARLMHNTKIKLAAGVAERRRNSFLRDQLEVLRPFIMGAKRSLQVVLGVEAQPGTAAAEEEDEPPEEEEAELVAVEKISCPV